MAERPDKSEGFIKKYGSIIIAFIALILTMFNLVQTYYIKDRELVNIGDMIESDYYFDGNNVYKEFSFIISNNSQVSVSITEIRLEIEGKNVEYRYGENSSKLPINLNSCNSASQSIYVYLDIDESDRELIESEYGSNCFINTYEMIVLLEDRKNSAKGTTIKVQSGLVLDVITSKDNTFTYERWGGASA